MADLGDYLTSINQSKINLMRTRPDDPKAVSGFSGFWVRRLLSYHYDCILIVNEINLFKDLDPQLQYEYLLHGITKGKRFAKTPKPTTAKNLELIKQFYGYSDTKAMQVIALHSEADLEKMAKHMDQGGVIT